MRRLAALALAAAFVAAGCGDEETVTGAPGATRTPAPKLSTPALGSPPSPRLSASVEQRLAAGGVGVIGLDARGGIAPGRLQLNREQQVLRLEWTGWGTPRATGRGRVRNLVCNPNCARGRIAYSLGTVTLSDIRLCGSRRFYAKAKLATSDPDSGRAETPATYLRTPC